MKLVDREIFYRKESEFEKMKVGYKEIFAQKGGPAYERIIQIIQEIEKVIQNHPVSLGLTVLLNLMVHGFKELGYSKEDVATIVFRCGIWLEHDEEEGNDELDKR